MNIEHINNIYLIGIGGIGMSGLARYFKHIGCQVSGYDKTPTPLTRELEMEGMHIIYEDSPSQVPSAMLDMVADTLVIYTPAVPRNAALVRAFEENGHVLHKRSEVLGYLSASKFTVAVAGTHGKTTTSTMVAHILTASGRSCSAFLGGIALNYNSNVLFADTDLMVVEADEFDRSFLTLHPNVAIVTSMDADHLDIYGDHQHLIDSFSMFIGQVKSEGVRIIRKGLDLPADYHYAAGELTDVFADNIRVVNGDFYFDFHQGEELIADIQLGIPGLHNIENAVAAIAAARACGVENVAVKTALASFKGIKRRFQYVVRSEASVYIDDYAHHPTELEAIFQAVNHIYPERSLTVIFQPHLFSRTRDFVEGFARALSFEGIGQLIVMPIYPAREEPIEGVDSDWLLSRVVANNKLLLNEGQVIDYIKQHRPELILTVGAGDIDRLVLPIKELLTNV
jgi:UDP-N-acetylmuramate--alanine ligase